MAKIVVGKILSAHGIRGEVKVRPLTDNPHRFAVGERLFLEREEAYFTIAGLREVKDGILLVKFASIDDRDKAEALKSSLLQVEAEDAAPLAEGSYYHFQLVGMDVFEEDGTLLGTLTELVDSGANDVYRVEDAAGNVLLLPALKDVVRAVDVEAKRMTVRLLPGLREACSYHER